MLCTWALSSWLGATCLQARRPLRSCPGSESSHLIPSSLSGFRTRVPRFALCIGAATARETWTYDVLTSSAQQSPAAVAHLGTHTFTSTQHCHSTHITRVPQSHSFLSYQCEQRCLTSIFLLPSMNVPSLTTQLTCPSASGVHPWPQHTALSDMPMGFICLLHNFQFNQAHTLLLTPKATIVTCLHLLALRSGFVFKTYSWYMWPLDKVVNAKDRP